MNLEQSFNVAWENTHKKSHALFPTNSFFNHDVNSENFLIANEFIHKGLDFFFHSCLNETTTINTDSIVNLFDNLRSGIKEIKLVVFENHKDEPWLDTCIAKLNNMPTYLIESFAKDFNDIHLEDIKFSKFKSISAYFDKFINKKENLIKKNSEDTYRELTELHINKILNEWNLASIHLLDKKSWQEHFGDVQNIYNSVNLCHKQNGLPTLNLGADKKLNLVLSTDFLNDMKWDGFQTNTNSSFSIFIQPEQLNINKTWTHEYTHFLDRLAAQKYHNEYNDDIHISTFSHLALDSLFHHKSPRNDALKIMTETMSATVGGLNSQDFYKKIATTVNNVQQDIKMKVIFSTLPDNNKTWESLSQTEQYILLHNPSITKIVNFIMLQVSNHPNGSIGLTNNDTLAAFEGDKIHDSHIFIPDVIHDIVQKINLNQFSMHSNLIEYIKDDLFNDIKEIMQKNNLVIYKDHSIYDDRFFFSPGNDATKAAQKIQDDDNTIQFSYYDKPLELLARMSENLQDPLMNNYEYNCWIKKEKTNKFIQPILGKDERMMLCATLHSMARYVGIEVPNYDLEHLPCVLPQNIDATFNLPVDDISQLQFAKPNQIIPDESHKKDILQKIEQLRTNIFQKENIGSQIQP